MASSAALRVWEGVLLLVATRLPSSRSRPLGVVGKMKTKKDGDDDDD